MTEEFDEIEKDIWISKSEKKRKLQELDTLALKLVSLSVDQLRNLPLSSELVEAITIATKIKKKKEGLRRQMQLISKILRSEEIDSIKAAMSESTFRHRSSDAHLDKFKTIRDDMLLRSDEAINEFVEEYAQADRQRLRQLIRQANKETKKEASKTSDEEEKKVKLPKASKDLLNYIKTLVVQK